MDAFQLSLHDMGPSSAWGQSAAIAVVTSISNPLGDFKGGFHYLRIGAPGLRREYDLWHTMK